MNEFEILVTKDGAPVKMWTHGVPVEDKAKVQLLKAAQLPFIYKHIAVMPDVHPGIGSTVGSVIPTKGAIIPAAVGVDIGCGMMAVKTDLKAEDLPENLLGFRTAIEKAVPHGVSPRRYRNKGTRRDKGSWHNPPVRSELAWKQLAERFSIICEKLPELEKTNHLNHMGTLGGGNHFIEICLDENQQVWFMLHSGSRGVGNAIGRRYIEMARNDMEKWKINLPDRDLAYFSEGTDYFHDYVFAVDWAQDFAHKNREVMMANIVDAVQAELGRSFNINIQAIDCHHNYVSRENHFGENIFVTRKGAVRARTGEMGIIPGSMGERSFIVRGLGNIESFCSCSHGAGRIMSRTEAKKRFTLEDQLEETAGVECRKDKAVIDEIPSAYKNIDAVMSAQKALVEVVHTLKQVVCVKG